MRFSSSNPSHAVRADARRCGDVEPAHAASPRGEQQVDSRGEQLFVRKGVGSGRLRQGGWLVKCLIAVLGAVLLTTPSDRRSAFAQPPGTVPPKQVLDPDGGDEEGGLPIRGFMFLTESGNQVMMPGLSWEEIERLLDQDSGTDAARQAFSYQSLEITGSTEQDRAEMEVVLRLSVEPTNGRWVSIPLRMSNFHRLAPPDVTGVDEYFMTLSPDDTGYLLFVKTETRHDVMLRMRVAARVEVSSAARTLAFRLPDVPSNVELTADAEGVSGEVVGRGDEAITSESVAGRRTRFTVDSGGGTFSLRWGKLARSTDNAPLLEVDSRISVRWDSPQDQPIASIRMTLKNVHGSIDSFQLRLPNGSVVLEPPRLGTSGQTLELGAATSDREGETREVLIPQEERQQRIDLNFDLQLANNNASATSPLSFRVPEVVGSLRHRGEIEIQTGGDYRLRWRARPWIRSELGESSDEASSGRSYRFRFDRASFELPLWLGEKERQLRMSSRSQITIRESLASLEMTIQVNGQASDGRLQFDDAGWRLSSIEDLETGEPLESFEADSYRVIELNSGSGEGLGPIRILAEHPLDATSSDVRFGLPGVVEVDETALVQSAAVTIMSSGRTMLVVDLESSTGLSRVAPSVTDTNADSPVANFRVSTPGESASVVGTLIDQPPRINLESETTIELDGEQLRTTVDWTVSSSLDLEGRLPVRIPERFSTVSPETRTAGDIVGDPFMDGTLGVGSVIDSRNGNVSEPWIVTVDGVPAVLRGVDETHYALISDRLASGTMKVRWRHAQEVRSRISDGSIETVALPRPDFADVTVRGAMPVRLRGNEQLNLISADSFDVSNLELESLPRAPIRLKFQSRLTAQEELSIRQMILRTAIGRSTRHERVLVTVQGGDDFRVGLPDTADEVSVEGFIDGRSVPVRREGNTLALQLPGDQASHAVDLRVWIAATTPSSFARVEPMVELPIGAGRVFWQIIAPLDGHVIWASPTLGRSMTWRFDGWKLDREASYGDQALMEMAGATDNPELPPGNDYLYVGSDLRSFQVVVVSRVVLWIAIGSLVLLAAVTLSHFPQSRHPLTAVVVAVLFAGLLAIAPDAAVLAGQFGIIAMVLVIVMFAIRVLIAPSQGDRVFGSTRGNGSSNHPSTRSRKESPTAEGPGIASTQALPAPTEASP